MSEAPKHDYDDLFKAIGEVTVIWAYLEKSLTSLTDAIWHRWGGKDLGDPFPRTALSRKIDLLQKWNSSDPRWPSLFPDFDRLIDRIDKTSEHRHHIIHGIADGLETFPETGVARMVMDLKRTEHRVTKARRDYTIGDLTELRNHVLDLALVLVDVADIFHGTPKASEEAQEALRKAAGRLP